MKGSACGVQAYGAGKFWVAVGDTQPETYQHGPFEDEAEAVAEAGHLMDEDDEDCGAVGLGEEVELNVPDADEIIERMGEGLHEQCGEVCDDYLRHVTAEQKAELTAAVEGVVSLWLSKHALWPKFCRVDVVRELTALDRLHAEQEVKSHE